SVRHYCTMPPKKKGVETSKKTVEKKKDKVIEDKTFGLKNKKGKKQQEYVKQVTHQVKYGGNPITRKVSNSTFRSITCSRKKLEVEAKKKDKEEANKLFKPAITQKIPAGADPKSVVCAFFKQGQCSKGDKCKFSHDLNLDRKGEKRSLYVDKRDAEEDELQNDTMDKWDQQKLEEVIEQKHGIKEKCMPKTEIRLRLGPNLTKITLETFLQWKQRKLKEKRAAYEKDQEKKKDDFRSGRIVGKVSGREVFQFKPELVGADDADDDEETEDISIYKKKDDDDEDEIKVVDISVESMIAAAREADETGTVAKQDRSKENEEPKKTADTKDTDVNGLDEACGNTPQENGQDGPPVVDGVPIEESLFDEDLELDELEIVD
ncbi:hypothetical protein QZH41_019205, partial [Actinostola sp. cb2023]